MVIIYKAITDAVFIRLYTLLEGSYMFFHALTFAVARGSCLNPRPPGRGFKLLPRDTVNVNALK